MRNLGVDELALGGTNTGQKATGALAVVTGLRLFPVMGLGKGTWFFLSLTHGSLIRLIHLLQYLYTDVDIHCFSWLCHSRLGSISLHAFL